MHRIGRTARGGGEGTAYTFFTIKNANKARDLVSVLREAKQEVPSRLMEMADAYGGASLKDSCFAGCCKRERDKGLDSERERVCVCVFFFSRSALHPPLPPSSSLLLMPCHVTLTPSLPLPTACLFTSC